MFGQGLRSVPSRYFSSIVDLASCALLSPSGALCIAFIAALLLDRLLVRTVGAEKY